MNDRPPNCQAHCDHCTGTIICTRCGVQWDADDDDPPECPLELVSRRVTPFKEKKMIVVSTPAHGHSVIKQLFEDLKS
jgi:hypothetical protein